MHQKNNSEESAPTRQSVSPRPSQPSASAEDKEVQKNQTPQSPPTPPSIQKNQSIPTTPSIPTPQLSPAARLASRFPTYGEFYRAFSPSIMGAVALYPEKCICAEDSPALSVISRAYGRPCTVSWLLTILSNWQEALPVSGKMKTPILHLLACQLADTYHYLRASEIMLFLSRLASGAYSVHWYGQVNPDTIIDALRTRYLPERATLLQKKEQERQEQKDKGHPLTWEEYCRRHNISRPSPLSETQESLDKNQK